MPSETLLYIFSNILTFIFIQKSTSLDNFIFQIYHSPIIF